MVIENKTADGAGLKTRFVIFAAPRTGSNWLCSLLESHPEILCHHEIFNPERVIYAICCREGDFCLGSFEERNAHPQRFLEKVWQHNLGFRTVGFKLNRGQEPVAFQEVFRDRAVRKILLKRKNRLKTYVSETIALKTGEWESYHWSGLSHKEVRIEVEPSALRRHIAFNDHYYDWIRQSVEATGESLLELNYENLSDSQEHERLLSFLGARLASLRAATRKQNPSNLRQLISNFDELAMELRSSDLEDELHAIGR